MSKGSVRRLSLVLAIAAMPSVASAFNFVSGWNLAGNAKDKPIDVPATFGTSGAPVSGISNNVQTVWKWDAVAQKWAFFSPTLDMAGNANYAASRGFLVLKNILPGEGFWVNAAASISVPDPAGAAFVLKPWHLMPNWNLVATDANVTAAAFGNNSNLAPFSAQTIWAWDAANRKWYFHAPPLDSSAEANQISTKGYLDFGSRTFTHGSGFWVNRTTVTGSPTANLGAVDQSKQMMAELRTTGNSWANATGSGALNAQMSQMGNTAKDVAVPATVDLAYRLNAIMNGADLYDQVRLGSGSGYHTLSSGNLYYASTWQSDGPMQSGHIPGFAFYQCSTNNMTAIAANQLTAVNCTVWDQEVDWKYLYTDGTQSSLQLSGKTLYTVVDGSPRTRITISYDSANSRYNVAARRQTDVWSFNGSIWMMTTTNGSANTGMLQLTRDQTSGKPTSIIFNGTMPATRAGADHMTANVNVSRTLITSGYSSTTINNVTYNPYRYDISGGFAGYAADNSPVFNISLVSGSNMQFMASAANALSPDNALLGINLTTVVAAGGMRATGSMVASSFQTDGDSAGYLPTTLSFAGTFEDISAGGVGQVFNGSITSTISNYSGYHSTLPSSSSNYVHAQLNVNGSLQLPSRPPMGLSLSATKTGPTSTSLSGQYTYGNGVTLNISATEDTANPSADIMTITNQDGIVWTMPKNANGTLAKGGTQTGTINNNTSMINYTDGSFESLR